MKLRTYQESASIEIRAARASTNKALVVMATGLGKTTVAIWDVLDFITSTPKKVRILYLVHSNHILYQSLRAFERELALPRYVFGVFNGEEREDGRQFTFATFQTMARHLLEFHVEYFDYIIADECHHVGAETYDEVIQHFNPTFLLGLTATPYREGGKTLALRFGNPVVNIPLEEAIVHGYTAPMTYIAITDDMLEVARSDAELSLGITRGALNRVVFIPKYDEEIVGIIEQKLLEHNVTDPRIIIFCSSIKHLHQFSKELANNISFEFRSLYSRSGVSRETEDQYLAEFRTGEINTLLAVNKLNEGIDLPEANVAVFLRSTESETVFTQQCGRPARLLENKKTLILDFVGNLHHLDTVRKIYASVEAKKQSASVEKDTVLVQTKSSFTFDAKTLTAMHLIESFRSKKTKISILEQICYMRRTLGHTPCIGEWHEYAYDLGFTSVYIITQQFGSWAKAVKASGFTVRTARHIWNDSEIQEQLYILTRWHRSTPTIEQLMEFSNLRKSWTFGSPDETETTWKIHLEKFRRRAI